MPDLDDNANNGGFNATHKVMRPQRDRDNVLNVARKIRPDAA